MAFDEAAQIHEIFDRNREWTEGLFVAEGILIGPWVVIYGLVVIIFVLCYFQFFLCLPIPYKLLFAFAGGIFVLGAIGLEMVGAHVWTIEGKSLMFEIVNSVEEIMEMLGVTLAIYGLLSYINDHYGSLQLVICDEKM